MMVKKPINQRSAVDNPFIEYPLVMNKRECVRVRRMTLSRHVRKKMSRKISNEGEKKCNQIAFVTSRLTLPRCRTVRRDLENRRLRVSAFNT